MRGDVAGGKGSGMAKSSAAFRTISEVADELAVPKHVLRFWEMRFPQVRPMKRGGGRRYYRPADVALLKGIRHLLHAEGYTIRGVQKILRDQGPEGVQRCWQAEAGDGATADAAVATRLDPAVAVRETVTGPATGRLEHRRLIAAVIADLEACRDRLAATLDPGQVRPLETAAAPSAGRPRTRPTASAAPEAPARKRSRH